jgi:hypothetical protein
MFYPKPSLDDPKTSPASPQPPIPVTFNKGSLLARLEQGEPLESIKAKPSKFPKSKNKQKQQKLKNWFGLKAAPVELPAEDVPSKVELCGDASAQKKLVELDSQAIVELPTNPSKAGQQKEESAGWARFSQRRVEKARIKQERADRELASRAELDGTETHAVPHLHDAVQLQEPTKDETETISIEPLDGVNSLRQIVVSQEQVVVSQDNPVLSLEDKERELRWLENIESQIQVRKLRLLETTTEP